MQRSNMSVQIILPVKCLHVSSIPVTFGYRAIHLLAGWACSWMPRELVAVKIFAILEPNTALGEFALKSPLVSLVMLAAGGSATISG